MGQTGRSLVCMGLMVGLLCGGWRSNAADSLHWRKDADRVDAEINGWDLSRLLEELTTVTDWQIFVEPNARHTVSTKFKDRTPGEALRLLLGDLSFALLPQTNGPSKFFVFRTSLQDATRLVRAPEKAAPAKAGKSIPNELIVTLKKGAKIDDLARLLGAKLIGRADELNAYRLQFDSADSAAAARDLLKNNGDVESVDSNYAVFPEPSPEALSFSSIPPLNLKPKAVGDTDRLIVGLIDTAVHPQSGGISSLLLPALSVAGDGQPRGDQITHGDSMAQTLLRSVATMTDSSEGTRVRLLPVDVYGDNPNTTMYDVAVGVYKAINSGAAVINLSLGGDGNSEFLHNVVKSGYDQGVLFFAAAGNEPTSQPSYPAAWPEVVAVTAGDRNGQIARYANRGDFVDAVAPGSAIVNFGGQSYLVSGTSVSTANVSGFIVGQAASSDKKPKDILPTLLKVLAPTQTP